MQSLPRTQAMRCRLRGLHKPRLEAEAEVITWNRGELVQQMDGRYYVIGNVDLGTTQAMMKAFVLRVMCHVSKMPSWLSCSHRHHELRSVAPVCAL